METAENIAVPSQVLLPLDEPRTIVLRAGEKNFEYTMRRIPQSAWEKYFRGIVNEVRNLDGEREQVFESQTALLELVTSQLDSVMGFYPMPANWRNTVPIQHRLAVGAVLCSVGPSDKPKQDAMLSDLAEVELTCCWSKGEDGKMQIYSGLVHRFRQPTIEQLKKFNYELARVRVTGTAKDGVTRYPSRQAAAMKMYDELIESVDGYCVRGEALVDPEDIKAHMDGAHKAEAALQIFAGGDSIYVA